jgi:hypothetical protein
MGRYSSPRLPPPAPRGFSRYPRIGAAVLFFATTDRSGSIIRFDREIIQPWTP